MDKINEKNIWLVIRTLLVVIAIVAVKWVCMDFGFEVMGFNTLFSAIVAANVFLMGFLLSGVMADYKESEKIPGEIAAILSGTYDEFYYLNIEKKSNISLKGIEFTQDLGRLIESWFFEKVKTEEVLKKISRYYPLFIELESITQPNYIMRLKNELGNLKKMIIRAETIRDTSFITSGYVIAMITTALLCIGLEFSHIGTLLESLFIVGAISFLMIFLLNLIHDLDNPFSYKEKFSAENISLHPLSRAISEMHDEV